MDSLVALALRRAPALRARDAELAASREEIPAAGALPDPMIALSVRGEDFPGSGLGADPMAMTALEFTQRIPWPGKRGRRSAAAAARVPELAAAREAERRALAADVREAWASLHARDGAMAGLNQAMSLLEVLEAQALARYETGVAPMGDWLALRRARAAQASDLDRERGERVEVVARLAAALDDTAAAAAATAATLPQATGPESGLAAATADGSTFAEVALAAAGVETAGRQREAADSEGRPDLIVGAEYGWRDTLAPMVTARVGLELPLWKGRKQDATARAAAHLEAVARSAQRDALLRANAEARRLAARRQAAAAAAARLRAQILPLLELEAGSARIRYLAGESPVTALLATLTERAEARAQLAREEAAAYAAHARLQALSGHDPVAGDGREVR